MNLIASRTLATLNTHVVRRDNLTSYYATAPRWRCTCGDTAETLDWPRVHLAEAIAADLNLTPLLEHLAADRAHSHCAFRPAAHVLLAESDDA